MVKNFGGQGNNGILGKQVFLPIEPTQVHEKSLKALVRYVIRKPSQLHAFWPLESSTQPPSVDRPSPHFESAENQYTEVDIKKLLGNIQEMTRKSAKELKELAEKQNKQRQQEHEQVMREVAKNAEKSQREHEQFMREIEELRRENQTAWARFWSFILQFMPFQSQDGKKSRKVQNHAESEKRKESG